LMACAQVAESSGRMLPLQELGMKIRPMPRLPAPLKVYGMPRLL